MGEVSPSKGRCFRFNCKNKEITGFKSPWTLGSGTWHLCSKLQKRGCGKPRKSLMPCGIYRMASVVFDTLGGDTRIWIAQGTCYHSMIVTDCFSFFTNIITFRTCLCYCFRADFSRLRETIRENFMHVFRAKMALLLLHVLILCQDFLVILCNFILKLQTYI